MNFATASSTIRTRLASVLTIPMLHDNGVLELAQSNRLHCRVSVTFDSSQLIELGRKRWRNHGTLVVEFKAPVASGDAAILAQCDTMIPSFRSEIVSEITYLTPNVIRVGEVSGWYRIVVECPFHFEAVE